MPLVSVDIHTHRQFAVMTALLVGVLVAVYLHVVSLGDQAGAFLQTHGAMPHRIVTLLHWRHPYRSLSAVQSILTSLLLQGNALHLAGNVLLLLLFGASVEDRISHYRFAMLFIVSGAIAILAQCLVDPESRIALVGAQGGVAGVAGACLAISPRGNVPTMIRGVQFPWLFGPLVWLLLTILGSVSPLPLPPGVASVELPYLLLAFACGVGLGEFHRRHRPVLLRG